MQFAQNAKERRKPLNNPFLLIKVAILYVFRLYISFLCSYSFNLQINLLLPSNSHTVRGSKRRNFFIPKWRCGVVLFTISWLLHIVFVYLFIYTIFRQTGKFVEPNGPGAHNRVSKARPKTLRGILWLEKTEKSLFYSPFWKEFDSRRFWNWVLGFGFWMKGSRKDETAKIYNESWYRHL